MSLHLTVRWGFAAALAVAVTLGACSDDRTPTGNDSAPEAARHAAPAPTPLVDATYDGATLTLWPYTTDDFTNAKDPVNLLLLGNADPRGPALRR